MQLDIETIIVLGVVTLVNIALAWVSSNYAKLAGEAAKRALEASASKAEKEIGE